MSTDWRDAQIERLTERVDRIEQERREERQRVLDRWMYLMLVLVWVLVIVTVTVAAVTAGTR